MQNNINIQTIQTIHTNAIKTNRQSIKIQNDKSIKQHKP